MATNEEGFDFDWKSTPEERYDTNMMALAKQAIADAGLPAGDEWGGTAFGEFSKGDLISDNGLSAVTNLEKAAEVAAAISKAVGHPVKVTAQSEYL